MRFPRHVIICLVILLSLSRVAGAAVSPAGTELRPQDATHGSLWLREAEGQGYQPAPTLETAVDMDITGMLARVRVRQAFHNPGQRWAEGVYVFPLPEQAAVDHLRMHIGERVIQGQIREREAAKKTYTQARQAGQRASLVEQERPNIFTTSLANIAPGETLTVEIEYQQTVHYSAGAFRLRFPTLVGPRYIPGQALQMEQQVSAFSGSGWAQATDQVADAARITPPVQHPDQGLINPVTLAIHLNAGMPLADVTSSYHAIERQRSGKGAYSIRLAQGPVPAERDFELVWRPQTDATPNAAWFVQHKDGQAYGLLMLVPPQQDATPPVSRELVFVIDTSGSMHGDSIQQARKALLLALDRLGERDRFNIIQFNNSASSLFSASRSADAANLAMAREFVSGLHAGGGTEMLPALDMALRHTESRHGLRQVIFLTDGSVGNERELFQLIRRRLGHSRLFTIGIGSAPNSHFMRKAAEYGRGSFTYIGKTGEVMEKMSGLLRKLEQPALSDIRLELPPGTQLDVLPQRIPDLYAGEPLLLALHGADLPGWLTLHGRRGEQPWTSRVTLDGGKPGAALAPEWGRRRIAALMTRLHDADSDGDRQALREEVIATALDHHLVSKYTSLVAVDLTPARQRQELLSRHAMRTNLPQGWSYEHVFGLPQTATPARLQLFTGLSLLLLAAGAGFWSRRLRCRKSLPSACC